MSTIGYAAEKLREAVRGLALGRGQIKDRLESAATYVAMAAGAKHEMPADLRAEYESALATLTAVAGKGGEDSPPAIKRLMLLSPKAR